MRAGLGLLVCAAIAACTSLGGLTGGDDGTPSPGPSDGGVEGTADGPSGGETGSPPGDGGADTGPPIAAKYRRAMPITNNNETTALPAGYTACFASAGVAGVELVSTGKVRSDYADLRVFGPSGERARVLEPLATGRTELCFRLERGIAANAVDDGYELRYGDPDAGAPPNAMAVVFDFHDDFDGTALDTRWLVNGAPTLSGGILTLPKNGQPGITTAAGSDGIDVNASLEMRVKVDDPTSNPDSVNQFYYWFGFQHTGDFNAYEPWTLFAARSKGTIEAEHKTDTGSCTGGCVDAPHTQTTTFRVYRIDRTAAGATFLYDDGSAYTAVSPAGDLSVMLRNWMVTSDVEVDWVRARPTITPEPTTTLGPEQSVP